MLHTGEPREGPVRSTGGRRMGPLLISAVYFTKCKCASRAQPVAWYDHENSTGVKFRQDIHSALLAINRTGSKKWTRLLDVCDWDISKSHRVCCIHSPRSQRYCHGTSELIIKYIGVSPACFGVCVARFILINHIILCVQAQTFSVITTEFLDIMFD